MVSNKKLLLHANLCTGLSPSPFGCEGSQRKETVDEQPKDIDTTTLVDSSCDDCENKNLNVPTSHIVEKQDVTKSPSSTC